MRLCTSGIYLLMLCANCFIASIETGDTCGYEPEIPEWEPDDSPVPGFLKLEIHNATSTKNPVIVAEVTNMTEHVSLMLYANPFILDGNCPNISSSFSQLRKHYLEYEINVGGREGATYFFAKAFTGCYYAQMTNAEGKNWIGSPTFFKTSYHYYDTMLKCKDKEYGPQDSEKQAHYSYDLEIPQTCFILRCQLWELDRDRVTNNTINDLNSGKIMASQICDMTIDNNTTTLDCLLRDTNLTLTTEFGGLQNEAWSVVVTWNHLTRNSADYYAKFDRVPSGKCPLPYLEMSEWRPVAMFNAIKIGPLDKNPYGPEGFLDSNPMLTIMLAIVLAIVITALLIFWKFQLAKIMIPGGRGRDEVLDGDEKIGKMYVPENSEDILLVYASDSSDNEFTKTMEAFRGRLQHICKVKVHDVYSADDYSSVAQLGTENWVRDVLKAGCKVVWVDTPYFRSVVNIDESKPGMENQYPSEDFRDGAIPYTLSVATNLFQKATIQYRRHFVVRLEGWKVSDGPDDPLQVVSPYVRYSIPAQFDRLCEDLAKKKHREIENGRIYLAPV